VELVKREWRYVEDQDMFFTLYASRTAEAGLVTFSFSVVPSSYLQPFIEMFTGTIRAVFKDETRAVSHIVDCTMNLSFGWTQGNWATLSSGVLYNNLMASNFKSMLAVFFSRTTQESELFTDTDQSTLVKEKSA
jgi:hypothetical protein